MNTYKTLKLLRSEWKMNPVTKVIPDKKKQQDKRKCKEKINNENFK